MIGFRRTLPVWSDRRNCFPRIPPQLAVPARRHLAPRSQTAVYDRISLASRFRAPTPGPFGALEHCAMIVRPLTVWALVSLAATVASAQELSCYSLTEDLSQGVERKAVVARSLTLFHANKVYDYIDSLQEVTIYEPVPRKFTVLQVKAGAAAEVTQDEIRRYLSLAEEQAAAEISQPSSAVPQRSLEWLQFQLQPKFEARLEASANRLLLTSPQFRYDVEGLKPPEPAVAEAYLKYADALAELNAVLHPSLLPGPRLQLNQELRTRELLPKSVRRTMRVDRVSDLRVEHQWSWKLTDHNRQLIQQWETELRKSSLRRLTFKELQQEVLSGRLTQR
jgi:hypothetical protein